jgi:hypothetical protein
LPQTLIHQIVIEPARWTKLQLITFYIIINKSTEN